MLTPPPPPQRMAAASLHSSAPLPRQKPFGPSKILDAPRALSLPVTKIGYGRIQSESRCRVKPLAATENARVPPPNGKKVNDPIVVIDNYDSFTYNLCQYMGELGCKFEVYRNDDLTVEELARRNPRGILISPGPGTPQDSGISLETVLKLGPIVPTFGVCMGLQCIGEAFGGKIVRSPFGIMHGKSSQVYYDEKGEDGLLSELPNPFVAGRYHSLVIENESFPGEALEVTAWTNDGLIMAARHKKYRHLQGVQFHPESIITSEGRTIVRNFVRLVEKFESQVE